MGLIYPHVADWLEELRDTHGDDFAEYLQAIDPQISENCIQHILLGGVVEASEVKAIMDFVAEGDPEGWCSLIGWEAWCLDAPVLIACIGQSEGQGGAVLELVGVFPDRDAAEKACKQLETRGERMTIRPPVSLRAFWGNGDADSTLPVSGVQWERIQAGQPFWGRALSSYEGEAPDVYWSFKDGRVTIEDDEGACHLVDMPVSELLVTVPSPTSSS